MSVFSSYAHKNADTLYVVFRVLVGILFLQHGMQKVGLLEGNFAVEGLLGFVGLCELVGGAAVFLGVVTRLVALLGVIELVAAYVTQHMQSGLLPIVNRGELALLYVAAFAVLFAHGAGKWSLEKSLTKKEMF